MNRDLERLIHALEESLQANPGTTEAARWEAFLDDYHADHPELERETLKRAVILAHRRWILAQQKPPSVPPTA